MQVELVSVETPIWSGEANAVYARTAEGELGILPGHAPLLGALEPGLDRADRPRGRRRAAVAVHGGFLSVRKDGVSVLAEMAENGRRDRRGPGPGTRSNGRPTTAPTSRGRAGPGAGPAARGRRDSLIGHGRDATGRAHRVDIRAGVLEPSAIVCLRSALILARERTCCARPARFPLAVRIARTGAGLYGVARYAGDELRWYRAFGLGTRPSRVLHREFAGRRQPALSPPATRCARYRRRRW